MGHVDTDDEPTPDLWAERLAEAAGCTPDELFAEVERFHRLADEIGTRQAMRQLAAEAGLTEGELQIEMEKLSSLESPA